MKSSIALLGLKKFMMSAKALYQWLFDLVIQGTDSNIHRKVCRVLINSHSFHVMAGALEGGELPVLPRSSIFDVNFLQ